MKNSWECLESTAGLLGEKLKCYLFAMPSPQGWLKLYGIINHYRMEYRNMLSFSLRLWRWQPVWTKSSRIKNGHILKGRYGCKSKKIWISRSQVWNSVPARTLRFGISVKMYPSSYDFIHNINSCVRCIDWLYICLACERRDMSSINKKVHQGGGNL